jgi:hypothetical protein
MIGAWIDREGRQLPISDISAFYQGIEVDAVTNVIYLLLNSLTDMQGNFNVLAAIGTCKTDDKYRFHHCVITGL